MYISAERDESLVVERLPGPEAWADVAAEWELLDQKIFPRTPFTSPSWISLWWKHFRRRNFLFRDEFFGHAVRDCNGRLVALAPLMRTYCLGYGPAIMRIVQFFGNDPSLTELRGVICQTEDHEAVVQALSSHFLKHRGEWDVFRWHGLRRPASEYPAAYAGSEFIPRGELFDYIVHTPAGWDELKARVSSNMRKNLRKAYEFLARDSISFTLNVIERPADIPSAIERFLSLHAARSEAADMIEHPNKFAKPHTRAFLSECIGRLSEIGQVRIFELEIGGQIVASRLTFLIGSDLYMYFAGYDTSWRQYSIMTVLMSEIVKWAIDRNIPRVNLSAGRDQSKLRWKPEEIVFYTAVQISPSLRGRCAFRSFLAYEALSRGRNIRIDRLGLEQSSA